MNEALSLAQYNKHITFIVKTSFDCNLNCSYCYEGERTKGQRMSIDTVKALTSKASDFEKETGTKFTFVWHGGEPLMMGRRFYEKAISAQTKCDNDFVSFNCLQTNGVLLTNDFAKSLIDNKVNVGVSLDGPPSIHDAQRKLCGAGGGSFMASYEALRTLLANGGQPGALAVFTRNTYTHLESFYDFFAERELGVKMNPLFLGGNANLANSQYLQITPEEYKESLIYLFDRWTSDESKSFDFDPFVAITRGMVSGNTRSCAQSGKCASFLKMFPNGDMHVCGMTPYENFKLGNIHKDSFKTILSSPHRSAYARARESLVNSCGKTCEHFSICHGGCVSYSYPLRGRHDDKTYFCASYKGLFDHMKGKVEAEKALYQRNSSQELSKCTFC